MSRELTHKCECGELIGDAFDQCETCEEIDRACKGKFDDFHIPYLGPQVLDVKDIVERKKKKEAKDGKRSTD